MWEVMNACVIMHNMIIKNENDNPVHDDHPYVCTRPLAEVDHQATIELGTFLAMHLIICDKHIHQQLQNDLMEHL
jgi:hypothetical protein